MIEDLDKVRRYLDKKEVKFLLIQNTWLRVFSINIYNLVVWPRQNNIIQGMSTGEIIKSFYAST